MNASPAPRVATAFTVAACALALAASCAVLVGWVWASTRGDWQAVLLWAYWFGAPALGGMAIAAGGRISAVRRINVALLVVWAGVSLVALLLPMS